MAPVSARSFYAKRAHQLHPDLTPENDFQILVLGENKLEGFSTAAKLEWLKQEWQKTVPVYGSVDTANAGIKQFLDIMVEPTGDKPGPDAPDATYIQIPDTNLSLRFWPGSANTMEYFMDIVETATKEPLNVPDGYEVWRVPVIAWLEPPPTRLDSLERSHGVSPDKIEKGSEKFILRDGMHCEMMHNGRKVMHFQVPTRPVAPGRFNILTPL